MLELLLALVVIALVIIIAQWLLSAIDMPQPVRTVLLVVIVLLCLLYLARRLGVAL